MRSPKVVGIGLHKSGTSSLAAALYTLGYQVAGHTAMGPGYDYDRLRSLDRAEARTEVWRRLETVLTTADAAQDSPWWDFYREIDDAFPQTRFILTIREREKWLRSVQNHFGRRSNDWDRWLFDGNNSVDQPGVYRQRYDAHHADVEAYFAARPSDLLVVGIEAGLSWGPLCAFLDLPEPHYPFPQTNAADARAAGLIGRIVRRARRLIESRSGRSDVQRAFRLYGAFHQATSQVRDVVETGGGDVSALVDRVLPRVVELKAAIGVPYEVGGAGDHGPGDLGAWRQLEFEVRHAVGQVTSFTIDSEVGSGTVETVCAELLDELSDFASR